MKNINQPLITIVTPSYNQGQFIEETITSVLNQSYQNIQYIIVDGGSTDSTMEVVEKYRDRINIVIHEKDDGQTDAITKGFKLAKGELVGWLNSDDILYSNAVEKIVKLYKENPDGAIYYGSKLDFIDEGGKVFKTNNNVIPNRDFLLNNNYSVIQQGSFYSLKYVKECNYLNKSLNFCMDLDLWLRLLQYGPIYKYNYEPIAAFRIWSDTKTSTSMVSFLSEIYKTLLNHGGRKFTLNTRRIFLLKIKGNIKTILNR